MGIAKEISDVLGRLNSRSSMDRHQSQLKFPPLQALERVDHLVDSSAQEAKAKIISNDVRRAQSATALLQNFELDTELWGAVAKKMASPVPSASAASRNETVDRESLRSLGRYLESVLLTAGQRIAETDEGLADVVQYGLLFLSEESEASTIDYVLFRKVWLLLWPVLTDFGLISESAREFRGIIQKLVTKSF